MDKFVTRFKNGDDKRLKNYTSHKSPTAKNLKENNMVSDASNSERHSNYETESNSDAPKRVRPYKKRKQNFRQMWLEQYKWLCEKDNKSYCTACNKQLTNNVAHLERHSNSTSHKQSIINKTNQPTIVDVEYQKNFQNTKNAIKIAELRIIMFILHFNLPFTLVSPLIELIKTVASDSNIAQKLKMGKTKATDTTNGLLQNEGIDLLKNILQKQKFSIIIDETTDVSTTKCLALVARYFDHKTNSVQDRFLSLLTLTNSTAQGIYNTLIEFFSSLKIPITNLVGLAADNAAVMMGTKTGVQALLRKDIEHLYVMGCVCHSLHLCSSAAAKYLPSNLEVLARNVHLFFAHSAKRLTEYQEFQEFFQVKTHKILKMSSTRWLSLQSVVLRILEQWVPLYHFFLSYEVDINADLAHSILADFNETNKVYFSFLSYILKLTNSINLEFQSESPRIHTFLPTMKSYFLTIISNFIKPEFINKDNLKNINICDQHIFLYVSDIYIGVKAQTIINSSKLSNESVREIKKCCRNYYIELCKQIKNRIDFDDEMLQLLVGINPLSLAPSLCNLIEKFPHVVPNCIIEELDSEWRHILHQELIPTTLELIEFWNQIFKLKNGLGQQMYPHVTGFISVILSLPHSSAAAERVFSQLNLIKNKTRNSLHVATINSIMLAKQLLPPNTDVISWIPSESCVKTYHK